MTLDDDVATRLQTEARHTGRPFKTVVNDHLRRSLAQRNEARAMKPFRVEPRDLGSPLPGRSYDSIGSLLDEIEGVDRG